VEVRRGFETLLLHGLNWISSYLDDFPRWDSQRMLHLHHKWDMKIPRFSNESIHLLGLWDLFLYWLESSRLKLERSRQLPDFFSLNVPSCISLIWFSRWKGSESRWMTESLSELKNRFAWFLNIYFEQLRQTDFLFLFWGLVNLKPSMWGICMPIFRPPVTLLWAENEVTNGQTDTPFLAWTVMNDNHNDFSKLPPELRSTGGIK